MGTSIFIFILYHLSFLLHNYTSVALFWIWNGLLHELVTSLRSISYIESFLFRFLGNFIGKGGAHADGTKSSGDKVKTDDNSYLHILITHPPHSHIHSQSLLPSLSRTPTRSLSHTHTLFLSLLLTPSVSPFFPLSGLWTRFLCGQFDWHHTHLEWHRLAKVSTSTSVLHRLICTSISLIISTLIISITNYRTPTSTLHSHCLSPTLFRCLSHSPTSTTLTLSIHPHLKLTIPPPFPNTSSDSQKEHHYEDRREGCDDCRWRFSICTSRSGRYLGIQPRCQTAGHHTSHHRGKHWLNLISCHLTWHSLK